MLTIARRIAPVTIIGRISIAQSDIDALLEYGFDAYDNPIRTEEEAFQILAKQKIRDHFPDDSVIKFNESECDMKYFH